MTVSDLFLRFFGIPWLGYGRRTEFLLLIGAVVYSSQCLFNPNAQGESFATYDLFWAGYGSIAAYSLAFYAVLSAYGLFGNICAWPMSRIARLCAGWCGAVIWSWFATKLVLVAPASVGFAGSVALAWAAIGLFILAARNLPPPGSPSYFPNG